MIENLNIAKTYSEYNIYYIYSHDKVTSAY